MPAGAFDVATIGIGENGHLAFNDPPADFDTLAPYLVVRLDEACRLQQVGEGWFAGLAEVPTEAISMGVRRILATDLVVCSVPDSRKAAAVRDAIVGPLSRDCPASILRTHAALSLHLDRPAAGLSCFTHLGNGCPHLLPRHDNILHRVLACEELPFVTLIADGVHLPPFLLGAMLRWLGPDRAIVVSDATAAAGMGMGTFQLGGQPVVVGEDGAAWSADRTHLVGSTATLSDLRRVLADVGQTPAAIDRLLAINPARALAAAAARGSYAP